MPRDVWACRDTGKVRSSTQNPQTPSIPRHPGPSTPAVATRSPPDSWPRCRPGSVLAQSSCGMQAAIVGGRRRASESSSPTVCFLVCGQMHHHQTCGPLIATNLLKISHLGGHIGGQSDALPHVGEGGQGQEGGGGEGGGVLQGQRQAVQDGRPKPESLRQDVERVGAFEV